MGFIQSGSETRIYRIFIDNKLDDLYIGQLSQHNSLTSFDYDAQNVLLTFDDEAENVLLNFLMISSTDILWQLKIAYKVQQAFKTKSTY